MSDQLISVEGTPLPVPPNPPVGPVFFFTSNGQPILPPVPVLPGATDLHIVFDPITGAVIAAWWTLRGLPGPNIPIPNGANDWYFATRPGLPLPAPIFPPPGANDFEVYWDGDRIIAAWWTHDGVPIEPLPLSAGTQAVHLMGRRPSPQEVGIVDLARTARGSITNANLVNFCHFEFPLPDIAGFHPVMVPHDVFHFRIGDTTNVMEVDLAPSADFRSIQRSTLEYSSPNVGFLKNPLTDFQVDLPQIKTISSAFSRSFVSTHPRSMAFYCLSGNLFNAFDGANIAPVFVAGDVSVYSRSVWTVAFIDIESRMALLGMFDAIAGEMLFATTCVLPQYIWPIIIFASFWGVTAKKIVLATMLLGVAAAIIALLIVIAAISAPATGPALTGAALAAALVSSTAFWGAIAALIAAIGSVIWIINCLISESGSAGSAAWTAKWQALQSKINAAMAKLQAAQANRNLQGVIDGLNDVKAALDEEKALANDPDSGMTDGQKNAIGGATDSAGSDIQKAVGALPK